MSAKALKYAEEDLGVHHVFEEVVELTTSLEVSQGKLDKAQASQREIESQILDRETDLIIEKRGTHPSMSDTRFKSEMKIWERSDESLVLLRQELLFIRAKIDKLRSDVEITKLRIKIGSSRMEELGGYLHYLAAVKNQAENGGKRTGETEA